MQRQTSRVHISREPVRSEKEHQGMQSAHEQLSRPPKVSVEFLKASLSLAATFPFLSTPEHPHKRLPSPYQD